MGRYWAMGSEGIRPPSRPAGGARLSTHSLSASYLSLVQRFAARWTGSGCREHSYGGFGGGHPQFHPQAPNLLTRRSVPGVPASAPESVYPQVKVHRVSDAHVLVRCCLLSL